jgi:hypothetical protein
MSLFSKNDFSNQNWSFVQQHIFEPKMILEKILILISLVQKF